MSALTSRIEAFGHIPGQIAFYSMPISFSTMQFPGGERHIRVDAPESQVTSWTIRACLYDANGVMDLLLLTDALRRLSNVPVSLEMPYVPYARQDRVANPGESLSAKVFASLINSQGFAQVFVFDPHSDVSVALLDRVTVMNSAQALVQLLAVGGNLGPGALGSFAKQGRSLALVAPDAGAVKRVEKLGKELNLHVMHAMKTRDTKTGKLSGTRVLDILPADGYLVIDDICDGGGTFILLAQALRAVTEKPLYLYVAHGLFTKGLDELKRHYDGIYTSHCANLAYVNETSLSVAAAQ